MYSLKDAIEDGYKPYELRTQKGYCTRKQRNPEAIAVQFAEGNRKGEPYYLAPSFKSTRYCFRVYLRKEYCSYACGGISILSTSSVPTVERR